MRRNCNLELRPLPHSADSWQTKRMEETSESPHELQKQQQLTIFYNGRVCVSEVTELQARAIILLASGDMDEKLIKTPTALMEPNSPINLQSPQLGNGNGNGSPSSALSMRRSLQRFLQKRKHRVQATSPYHY